MTPQANDTQRIAPDRLSTAERKRILSVIREVGRLYPLNGWRSVDWLGYCLDPDGQVHCCGRVLEMPRPPVQSDDIPSWNYRLHHHG